MKKILSIILTVIMTVTAIGASTITTNAEEVDNSSQTQIPDAYDIYMVNLLKYFENNYGYDSSIINSNFIEGTDYDDFYKIYYCSITTIPVEIEQNIIENYVIRSPKVPFGDKITSILLVNTEEVISLTEALERDIIELEDVVEYMSGIYKIGDVNGDGRIAINDATIIQKAILDLDYQGYIRKEKLELFPIAAIDSPDKDLTMDFNRDGKINILDASSIQKFILELE